MKEATSLSNSRPQLFHPQPHPLCALFVPQLLDASPERETELLDSLLDPADEVEVLH